MVGTTERDEKVLVFEYPRRQRLPLLLVLSWFVIFGLVIFVAAGVSAMQIITGRALLGGIGTNDPGTLMAALIVPALMIIGGVLVNLMFPAIHITSDGFRISRLLYTSPWLDWQNIRNIETHWLSSRSRVIIAITVEGISPWYRFIGMFELLGYKGFLIHDRINDYAELMRLLRNHRPDLFEPQAPQFQ